AFTLEANLLEPGTTFNTGPIDVSLYGGREVEVFVGFLADGSTDATLTVSAIRLYSRPQPVLKLRRDTETLVLSWPFTANGFNLQATTNPTQNNSWTTMTNGPSIINLQNTVTNPIAERIMFYRLKH